MPPPVADEGIAPRRRNKERSERTKRRAATMFLREAPRIESRKSISRKQTKKHNTTGCGAVGRGGMPPPVADEGIAPRRRNKERSERTKRRAATMFLREAPRIESRKSISRKQTKKHNTTGCGAVGSAGGLGPSGRRFEPCHSDHIEWS